jgi:ketosteroid isomerase-like protein
VSENARLPIDEAVIRRAFDAWNKRDFEGFLDAAHPDVEYAPGIVVGQAEGERVVYRGRAELREFFDEWHSVWQTHLTLESIEPAGEDAVLILGRMRMTGAQSGASAEQEVGWVGHVEDEQLRRLESFPTYEAARAAAERL